jgi:hypothetical protein
MKNALREKLRCICVVGPSSFHDGGALPHAFDYRTACIWPGVDARTRIFSEMKLLEDYKKAALASNRSFGQLVVEAARLRLSKRRLGLSEYIDFQLYKTDISWEEKCAFAGLRAQAVVEEILIDDYSRFLSLDKVTMYALLSGLNLPIPIVRATYRSIRPSALTQLQTKEDVAEFLNDPKNLPVYVKRSFGSYGRGNALVSGFDGTDVLLANGKKEPLADFCTSLDDGRTLGWIFQEPLSPHPEVQRLTKSSKVSGLRVHTFLSRSGSRITKAIFKINVGTRDSDNFEHGASGNMLGAVDIETGRITRTIAGVGIDQVENLPHPVTNLPIVGFEIPTWSEVVRLVNDAQKAFPGFLCPGWDIALCADGPKILEVNAFGDMDLSQHAHRRGFLDPGFVALLRERGLEELLVLPPKNHLRSPKNNRMGARRHHWLW